MSISKKSRTKIKNTGTFLVFAGPSLFFFVMTILVPLVYGVYLTFTDWNGISREKNIVGLAVPSINHYFYRNCGASCKLHSISFGKAGDEGSTFSEFLPCILFYPKSDRRSCPGVYLAVYFWKGVGGFWQIPGYWIPFKVLAV